MGVLVVPIIDARVSSPFGNRKDPFGEGTVFHKGVDFAAREGIVVMAAASGVIEVAQENNPTAGNFVVLRHPDGTRTRYLHLQKILIPKVGLKVNARQAIGTVGHTGKATGDHLHFDIQDKNGVFIDPGPMLGFVSLKQDVEVKSESIDKFPTALFGAAIVAGLILFGG